MKEIELSQGFKSTIDDEDLDLVMKYCWSVYNVDGRQYALANIIRDGKHTTIRMHNLILGCAFVDHKDGNGLNNRKVNLRAADHQLNAFNAKVRKDKIHSKYKGVTFNCGKWRARIRHNYKGIHIGYYASEIEAAIAYDRTALELFGEFAHTNFKGQLCENKQTMEACSYL